MSSPLDAQDVLRLAKLARLRVAEQDLPKLVQDLGRILAYVNQLAEIDTSAIEPTSHISAHDLYGRADTPQTSLAPEAALAEAPEVRDWAFVVPAFVDEG